MERETLKLKHSILWNNRPSISLQSIYDLPALMENLEKKQMGENHGLRSLILLKQPTKQVVMTSVKSGIEIEFFNALKNITIQIIKGKVGFRTRFEQYSLGTGQMTTLFRTKKYQMTVLEKAVFLVVIEEGAIGNSFMSLSTN
jgi:hypothetical protein